MVDAPFVQIFVVVMSGFRGTIFSGLRGYDITGPHRDINLPRYLDSLEMLREKYAQAREIQRIPIRVSDDMEITFSL